MILCNYEQHPVIVKNRPKPFSGVAEQTSAPKNLAELFWS
jgi:hypothetical protein